jgi:Zn-dependent protease
MNLEHVDILNIVFQMIVFVFAISVHEAAHAWMANLCGDPTARMLGRITLNPLKHIDPVGTILLPVVAMVTGLRVLGWGKPTPVDPRNFRHHVRDDILTSVVGPVSNLAVATVAVLALGLIKRVSPLGQQIIYGQAPETTSLLVPLCVLVYQLMVVNIVLAVFNLIPIPPLDGSHVLRHFLPEPALRVYDTVGMVGLFLLVFWGGGLLSRLIYPVIALFNSILVSI